MEAVFRTVTKVKDYINVTIIFYIEVSMTTKIRYLFMGFLILILSELFEKNNCQSKLFPESVYTAI